jgi:hypothetical protein
MDLKEIVGRVWSEAMVSTLMNLRGKHREGNLFSRRNTKAVLPIHT